LLEVERDEGRICTEEYLEGLVGVLVCLEKEDGERRRGRWRRPCTFHAVGRRPESAATTRSSSSVLVVSASPLYCTSHPRRPMTSSQLVASRRA